MRHRFPLRPTLLAALLVATLSPAAHAVPTPKAPEAVAWQDANGSADVDRAFAEARKAHKPLLLYWGAVWCPPCNQLKATLFNRQDFIERTRSFVTVHIDGDSAGAQQLGARFKVVGYPTLILFNPQGQEITRLPGEADAAQVVSVMDLGLADGRPIKSVLADALAAKSLPANEWRLLAFYSWDTDEQQLAPQDQRAALLAKLAAACPAADTEAKTRLQLKALADAGASDKVAEPAPVATRTAVTHLLADPAASRAQMDVLTNNAPELVKALAGHDAAARDALIAQFDSALQRLQADTTLSRADRFTALDARVELARLKAGIADDAHGVKLPAALQQQVREAAAREDREITSPYERQAVITEAAYTLGRVGLPKEADALLKANLSKSHSPYYLMSELAANAKARGDKTDALHWYQQAFETAKGPATRLQWGASYINALIELTPQDAPRIEHAVQAVWHEAAAQPAAFYERSARSLQKVAAKLQAWNADGRHAATLKTLQQQLDAVCAKLPAGDPQRATCEGLLKSQAQHAA
jgi:thioredoxin-related protein